MVHDPEEVGEVGLVVLSGAMLGEQALQDGLVAIAEGAKIAENSAALLEREVALDLRSGEEVAKLLHLVDAHRDLVEDRQLLLVLFLLVYAAELPHDPQVPLQGEVAVPLLLGSRSWQLAVEGSPPLYFALRCRRRDPFLPEEVVEHLPSGEVLQTFPGSEPRDEAGELLGVQHTVPVRVMVVKVR